MANEGVRSYPSELPVIALRQTVVFPLTLQPLAINRPGSIDAVTCKTCGKKFDIPSQHSMVFIEKGAPAAGSVPAGLDDDSRFNR